MSVLCFTPIACAHVLVPITSLFVLFRESSDRVGSNDLSSCRLVDTGDLGIFL